MALMANVGISIILLERLIRSTINIRTCSRAKAQIPLGPYHYKARIFDASHDTWAIDGSVLQLNDKLYFLFSAWDGPSQNLYIAAMSNPWTMSGSRILISKPTYDWETQGLNVNEGACCLAARWRHVYRLLSEFLQHT